MDEMQELIAAAGDPPWFARAYVAWLDEVYARSGSVRSEVAYRETFLAFLKRLERFGLWLDSPATDVADVAQAWAHMPNKRSGNPPLESTVSQRLAIVSGFYRFAIKRGHYDGPNPIERVDRPKVERYKNARALDFPAVRRRFAAIDRGTPEGLRDYALLTLAMHTGRRSAEIAALEWADLTFAEDGAITITWRRLKGGKSSTDTLDVVASAALQTWLDSTYGTRAQAIVDSHTPVWLSFARDIPSGVRRRLSSRSIAYICNKRMGTPRVHDLRHTFAAAMEEAGAKVSEIQAYLGHESIATTGIYLRKIRPTSNPYSGKVAELLGTDQEIS